MSRDFPVPSGAQKSWALASSIRYNRAERVSRASLGPAGEESGGLQHQDLAVMEESKAVIYSMHRKSPLEDLFLIEKSGKQQQVRPEC